MHRRWSAPIFCTFISIISPNYTSSRTGNNTPAGGWKAFFESQGYTTYAPAWPHKEASPAVLRSQHPDAPLAANRLSALKEYFSDFIKKLPEKPILIGHSYGGLITQLLVNRDLAAAGIAIHSVPPQGIIPLNFAFYKSTWGPLGFFTNSRKSFLMSLKQWQYSFTNGMSPEDQQASYDENCIPESKLVSRDGISSEARVDFKKPHAPLLIVAGEEDQIMPLEVNRTNFNRYSKTNGSITDWAISKGKNHFIVGLPTWKEDATFIANWINQH